MQEHVILVDEEDKPIGTAEKMQAHEDGSLHRAFSIFIFNDKGELLLQQRALDKYHSAGLWTNTCCSHPRPDEETIEAGHRRLMEEMGFDCELKEIFSFQYKHAFDNGLTENEYDHVLVGQYKGDPKPNPSEVNAYKWADTKWLQEDILKNSEIYSAWFKICLRKVLEHRD